MRYRRYACIQRCDAGMIGRRMIISIFERRAIVAGLVLAAIIVALFSNILFTGNSQRLRPDFHFAVFRAGRAHRLHAPRECLPLRSGLSIDPLALFGMERAAPGTYPALGSLHARRKAISSNTAVGVFLSNQSRADDFAF